MPEIEVVTHLKRLYTPINLILNEYTVEILVSNVAVYL